MKARRRIKRWLGLGLALAALSSTAAQAATRPDDRAGPLGVGTATLQSPAIPPDDRAGPLGVGAAALQNSTIRPDDRAGTLGVGTDIISRYLVSHPAAVRPDDRAGTLGVGSQPVAADTSDVVSRYLVSHPAAVRPDQSGSSWGTAGLAAASTLGALALALAGFALIRHRRSATEPCRASSQPGEAAWSHRLTCTFSFFPV